MNALVYSGPGAGNRSTQSALHALRSTLHPSIVHHVSTIDARTLIEEHREWQKTCCLLVMPGGADVPYCRDLGEAGTRIIREWVEEKGGFYLGLCAGAYFGSARVEFEKGTELEVVGDRRLRFYKGTARGSVYPGFCYQTEAGALAAPVRFIDPKTGIDDVGNIVGDGHLSWRMCCDYVNGGPYWMCHRDTSQVLRIHSIKTDVDVLATYPEKNHAVSAMRVKVGKGNAVLCSSHPELDSETWLHGPMNAISDHVQRRVEESHPDVEHDWKYLQHVKEMVRVLDAHADRRRDLWRLLLAAGGLKSSIIWD